MFRILFALLALTFVSARAAPAPAAADFSAVIAELEKIQLEDGLRNASIGFAVIELDTKNPSSLTGYYVDKALVPASTMKAITTATAVDLLGPDYRFKTALQHTGTIDDDGILNGDLVIKGGGDPTLGLAPISITFKNWQAALEKAGIKRIEGAVIGDATLFGTQLRSDDWQWGDLGNYYAAGACGLTFHQNLFLCRLKTGEPGTPATLEGTDPELPELEFVNEMRVGPEGSGDQGYIYGAPYTKLLYLRGTVPPGGPTFTIKGALPDPAYFCARAFTEHLTANGIEVTGEATTVRQRRIAGIEPPGDGEKLLEQESDPLTKLVATTNLYSDNLYAECIHRIIGVEMGDRGSTRAASESVLAYWKAKEIDLTGFHMADGSGLARTNTVTARQMTLILYHAARSQHFDTFSDSLPVAGESGTMRSIGLGSASAGRVRAKNGSMDRVTAYCGYVEAKSGKRFAFALLINNFTAGSTPLKSKIVHIWDKMVTL